MNAVTCANWLTHGILSSKPKKHVPNIKSIQSLTKTTEQDKATGEESEIIKIVDDYDLDDYSSDDDTASCLQNLTTFPDNKNDPYMKEFLRQNGNSSSEEDVIDSSDGIIVVGKTHRDYHSLEVWVINKDEESHTNLYCHHDYILTACPLTVECFSNVNVNLAAVGSLAPIIQLWDLDALNVVDPMLMLGDAEQNGHTDAVLSLSHKFVSQNSNLLLSGSADGTVALWCIQEGGGRCIQKSTLAHSDKIQAVQWHHVEDSIFSTGSFDEMVHVYDCRACFQGKKKPDCKWAVNGEVERILWDIHKPYNLYAAASTGEVYYFDIRMKKPIWLLNAHVPASVSGIAQSGLNNNCLVTTSDEGKAKIWDTKKCPAELVSTKLYKIGSIFCIVPSPDDPMIFCVGGEREMKIVDLKKDTKVSRYFCGQDALNVADKDDSNEDDIDTSNANYNSLTTNHCTVVVTDNLAESWRLKNTNNKKLRKNNISQISKLNEKPSKINNKYANVNNDDVDLSTLQNNTKSSKNTISVAPRYDDKHKLLEKNTNATSQNLDIHFYKKSIEKNNMLNNDCTAETLKSLKNDKISAVSHVNVIDNCNSYSTNSEGDNTAESTIRKKPKYNINNKESSISEDDELIEGEKLKVKKYSGQNSNVVKQSIKINKAKKKKVPTATLR